MSQARIEELIENSFRLHLTTSLSALSELSEIIKNNPEILTKSISEKFLRKIPDVSKLTEFQLDQIYEIGQTMVGIHGISSIPIEYLLSTMNIYAIKFSVLIILNATSDVIEKYTPLLFDTLISHDDKDVESYSSLLYALISINSPLVHELCKKQLLRYDWKIYGPLKILSEIGDEAFCDDFIRILNTSFKGITYDDIMNDIHGVIIDYFRRVKCEKMIISLFDLMEYHHGNNKILIDISKILSNMGAEILEDVLIFLDKTTKEHKTSISQYLLTALENIDESVIKQLNPNRFLSIFHPEPDRFLWRFQLSKIVPRLNDDIEPLLISMLDSDSKEEYEFSRECLEERGKNIFDYLEINPIIEIYNYFYNELPTRRDKPNLEAHLLGESGGNNLAQKQIFEHGVESLFSSCGFSTIWVDPSGVKCVDIVAISQDMNDILLLGCTTGVIKDDLDKMYEVSEKVSRRMEHCDIHPIVVINLEKEEIMRLEEAYKYDIGILSANEIRKILDLSRVGRPHKEILASILEISIDPNPLASFR